MASNIQLFSSICLSQAGYICGASSLSKAKSQRERFKNFLKKICSADLETFFSSSKRAMDMCRFLGILLGLWMIGLCSRGAVGALGSPAGKEAYATLLYSDEFLLGARVLGKSIRDTGTTKDMVALVVDGVSDYAERLLHADGWIVERVSLLTNPNRQVRPKRLWGIYTKLKIFNMTNYQKVVYLDADTLVIKNIDDLFKCGKFCANLRHSERMNAGVLVVEPSEEVFKDMMSKVTTLPSYTGGDQGFLCSYYPEFPNAHLFEPDLAPEVLKSRPVPEMERLSTLYNADVGLYMVSNGWKVEEKEIRVLHYTIGPLKPWQWWASWIMKPVDIWQNVRLHLEASLPGNGGGENPKDALVVKFLFLLPFVLILFFYYQPFLQTRSLCDHFRHLYYKFRAGGVLPYSAISSSTINSSPQFSNTLQSKVPAFLGGMSIFICSVAAATSLGFSLHIIPRQVTPWTGFLLMYEWTFTLFFLLFGSYLHIIYCWGKIVANRAGSFSTRSGSLDHDSGKGHQRPLSCCDCAAWYYYGIGMAFLALAVPSVRVKTLRIEKALKTHTYERKIPFYIHKIEFTKTLQNYLSTL